jgi:hypothetical protein
MMNTSPFAAASSCPLALWDQTQARWITVIWWRDIAEEYHRCLSMASGSCQEDSFARRLDV